MKPEYVSAIATSVSAGCAALGLFGLWLYTKYTRRMMASSEATFRATIEPFIVPSLVGEGSENPFTHRYLNLAVSNEGLGPALDVRHICFRDDEALSNFGHFIELPIPAMAFSIGKIRSKESVGEQAIYALECR